ncbi:MAG: heparan-alpha-glucosaminide N-acetyltransferase domain-containing protein [Tannerellaceae bacterium]|nr:heparan-alpha-glucosaminide N-acetyltransferase domain-containing protein [Tannerellaceae bacterium]
MTQTVQNGRLLSLDVMRGLTIAGMIMVNNPGSWQYVYAPLRHARWDGLTPTDLVFPFFMFIMGVSMFFSLRKYQFSFSPSSVLKIGKRTLVIFLIGAGLNLFGHLLRHGFGAFEQLRILGVLQRLALAYGIASLIGLAVNHKYLLHTAAGILLAYAALLAFTGSVALSADNLIAVVDRALLGESHMYRDTLADGTRIAFDPEGLLSVVGSVAHVLFGFYAGKLIQEGKRNNERILIGLFTLGTVLLFAGCLLQYGCPINKKLWSSTFVLTTCGLASLLLSLLIRTVDRKGGKRRLLFFETFGINPLYLYVQASLLASLCSISGLHAFVYGSVLAPALGPFGGSLAWAVLFVVLNWIPGYYWLYKKQIYIKI